MRRLDLKPWVKPLVWLAVTGMLVMQPAGQASERWVVLLLLFSPLVLMPLWFGEPENRLRRELETAAAIVLAGAFLRGPGMEAALFAVPWLLVRLVAAWQVAVNWRRQGLPSLPALCIDLASVFPVVGAAWLVAQRANWTPWGFDPLIVLLTAAHFHHAGFTLPLMAGLNARAKADGLARFSCLAILAGVPLVAVGITCTHFGVLPVVEPVAVAVLVVGALGVAVLQMRRGFQPARNTWRRAGLVVSGAALFVAMLLALGFGLRYFIPNLALTMPQMWMVHGTLNALGFGLCGILAWRGAPDGRSAFSPRAHPSADQTA